jgi:DNA-binding HxlR family transcriptional regulator
VFVVYDYQEYCPVAKASQLLCERWTFLIVRELLCGCTRFNQLRRYLPRISPGLLRKRLAVLESEDLVVRVKVRDGEHYEYRLTDSGRDLEGVIVALGTWACRWQYEKFSNDEINLEALMRDLASTLKSAEMPAERNVLRFLFEDLEASARWFVVVEGEMIEACEEDRGLDADVFISTKVKTLADVLIGQRQLGEAISCGDLKLTGSAPHIRSINRWFGLAPYAPAGPEKSRA